MAEPFDVAVIGAGPAGASAALEAARLARSVLLVDPNADGGDKPCGEGVMPSGVDVLAALGLGDAVARGRPFAGIRHVVEGAPPIEVDLPRFGVAIPRPALARAFDEALARAPRVVRARASATVARRGDAFAVAGVPGGDATARTVIAATGVGARAATWLAREGGGAPAPRDGRFGLRARFEEADPLDRVEVHMGRGCEVYLTPLPGAEVNVAVLYERAPEAVPGLDALLAHALERHPTASGRLGRRTTGPAGRSLSAPRPRAPSERGAFLAGDAGGLVDPIVGCGVSIALRTGVLAARGAHALLSGRAAGSVDRAYALAFRRECSARRALAAFLRRGDAHPRVARAVARLLGRMPVATRSMARIAGGA